MDRSRTRPPRDEAARDLSGLSPRRFEKRDAQLPSNACIRVSGYHAHLDHKHTHTHTGSRSRFPPIKEYAEIERSIPALELSRKRKLPSGKRRLTGTDRGRGGNRPMTRNRARAHAVPRTGPAELNSSRVEIRRGRTTTQRPRRIAPRNAKLDTRLVPRAARNSSRCRLTRRRIM